MSPMNICYSQISNLWPVYKPFNRIVSWSTGFKTGPVYAKLKSGSISRLARSKSRPARALDGLPPRAHGLSCAGKKLQSSRGTSLEASQFFFKLLLVILASHAGGPTNASADRFQYLIRTGVAWLSLASLPCLYASVDRFRAVRATGCLFGKLVQVSCRSGCL